MDRILVVDDELVIRNLLQAILIKAGYTVETAMDGFDALLRLNAAVPAILISDMNMPRMSGFELLSVVRRKYPQVGVIAMSGAFNGLTASIMCDHFFKKGNDLTTLVDIVHKIFEMRILTTNYNRTVAPLWISRSVDSTGMPYIVVTCPQCLRSSPVNIPLEDTAHVIRTTSCLSCDSPVTYIVDFSLDVQDGGVARLSPLVKSKDAA